MRTVIMFILLYCQGIAGFAQLSERIDTYVAPLVKNQDFSGVILVARGDSVLHLKGYGYANREWDIPNTQKTVFHLASLTKQFTAAALLVAEQMELLALRDPISRYIPDYPQGGDITIKQLLSHRSGITDYNELPGYEDYALRQNTLKEIVDWFKEEPLQFEPGTRFSYANSNFVLAAYILEVAADQPYMAFVREHLFIPLGMEQTGYFSYTDIIPYRATGYDPAPAGLMRSPYYNTSLKLGSGSMCASAPDLYAWDRALYTNEILTEASKQKLFTDYGNEYGLGWGVYERDSTGTFVSHDGKSPGFFAYFKRYMAREETTIILLSNINSGLLNSMKGDLTDLVFGRSVETPENYRIQPTPEHLSDYVGTYDFPPSFYFELIEGEDGLYFKWMDTPFLQYLTPIGEDRFLMRSRFDYLTFQRNDAGVVTGVSYQQAGGATDCTKRMN